MFCVNNFTNFFLYFCLLRPSYEVVCATKTRGVGEIFMFNNRENRFIKHEYFPHPWRLVAQTQPLHQTALTSRNINKKTKIDRSVFFPELLHYKSSFPSNEIRFIDPPFQIIIIVRKK